jgi:2-hydroxychromene-2-carboxylate isomerase
MKSIDFHFDFISPYAYLAFEHLPQALEGLSYQVTYRPILFAGLLKHYGQLGPAEIASKRDWTYRQVIWLAECNGITMQRPAAHPFNPLALLRLAWACARRGAPNRYVCETLFRHVWQGGGLADDPVRLAALAAMLAPQRDPASDEVKQALRAATESAIAQGVFGVPALVVDGRLFWGSDSLPMLRAYLNGGADADVLDRAWAAPDRVAAGVERKVGRG